jgi:DNA-binding FadR family transcriptional regulator
MSRVRRVGSRARSAIFAPLSDVGRAEQVEQRLTEAIRSGVLTQGERLPSESELAGRFGVAVVTVREALTGLRAQGLVTTSRGRGGGTFVAAGATADEDALAERLGAMSRAELQDRGTHYALVLAGCAELTAERADAEEAASLRRLLAAGLAERLEADFGMIVRIPLSDETFRERTLANHHSLIDAIAAGDTDTARKLAQAHLQETLDRVARTQAGIHDRQRLPRSAS